MSDTIYYFRDSVLPQQISGISGTITRPLCEGLAGEMIVEIVYGAGREPRQIFPEVIFRLGELWDQYYIARSELNAARNKAERPAVAPFTAYFNTAGEVESRNVQRRLNMTAEERQNSLLSETEDVAEESKIYLFEGGESLMAEPFTEDQKRQILALAPRSGVDVVHKILYGGSITRNGNTIHFDGKNSHALKLHLNAPGFHPRRGPVTLEEIEKYLPLALAQEPKIETKKNKKGKRSSNKIYKFTDGKITYTLVTASRGGVRSFYSNKKAANAVTDLDRSSATGMLHDNNIPQNPENASDTDNNLRFFVAPEEGIWMFGMLRRTACAGMRHAHSA